MHIEPASAPADVTLTPKGKRYVRRRDILAFPKPKRKIRLRVPRKALRALARLRAEAAAEIERLMAIVDEIDGDYDLEDGADDEPSTCASAAIGRGHGDDLEGDTADDEPSLGWTSTLNQTSRTRLAGSDDLEDEHDGREPDVDDEDGGDQEETWIREAPRPRPDTRAYPYRIGGVLVVGEVTS